MLKLLSIKNYWNRWGNICMVHRENKIAEMIKKRKVYTSLDKPNTRKYKNTKRISLERAKQKGEKLRKKLKI